MKQRAIIVIYSLIISVLYACHSDPCGDYRAPKSASVKFTIVLNPNDTMNLVKDIYYPQVNRKMPTSATTIYANYIYEFDETIVVLNYTHDTINKADTIIVKSSVSHFTYSECNQEFIPYFKPLELVSSTFSSTIASAASVTVNR